MNVYVKAPLTDRFSFDQLVVDPNSNAITINGVEKRLEPKLISLLCLLAAQGRDVISRQEITQAIWPDVVVGEESITRAIFALRNALGDDAKQPQYIETIPKKGYRFLVDVELVSETPNPAESADAVSIISGKRSWLIYSVCAALLVTALLVIIKRHEKPSLEIENILPLNKMEGVERSISLNSDGTKILFVHESGQKIDLYSRDLQTAKDELWVRDAFWKKSPVWIDDNTIAYIRGNGEIVRNYQGQPPQVLYTSTQQILELSMVSGNSENLFFLEFQNNNLIELKSINLVNGKQQNWRDIIPDLPNKIGHLQYSMKSNTLFIVKYESEKPKIASLDLNTKKISLINDHFSEINRIAVVSDHSLLVVGILGESEGIWFVDTQKQPQLVLRSSGSENIVDVQIDVKKSVIFYANAQKNMDVKLVSVNGPEGAALPELNSSGMEIQAVFANHDKFIYFVSNRTGYQEIWRYDRDSKSLKQITALKALLINWFSLSHGEKNVAVGYRSDNIYLAVIETETGRLQTQVSTPTLRFPLAWSLDNNTIYASEHQTKINLFSYDAKTLTQSLFADNSGLYVKELDGKKIVYIDYNRHALVEKNLVTQQEKILHDTIPTLSFLYPGKIKFNRAKDGFYAGCQIDWRDKICFYPLSATNSSPVAVSDIPYWQLLDISEDGERILAQDSKPPSGDIMKMQLRD